MCTLTYKKQGIISTKFRRVASSRQEQSRVIWGGTPVAVIFHLLSQRVGTGLFMFITIFYTVFQLPFCMSDAFFNKQNCYSLR
jgi:hypothetical protein